MEPRATRRRLLSVAGLAGLTACIGSDPTSIGRFEIQHAGQRVRCLYHRSAPTDVPPLAIVLLHGAGADASQWVDIGLRDAIDAVSARHPTALVAVAPDVDASSPVSMLLEGLLPAIEHRFRPHSAFGISGISRGAGQALETAVATPWRFESLGLHSPAVSASVEISRSPAAVMIDAGDRDPLERSARRLAADFARSGVAVTELWPPGGHDRQYWRAHLRSYLAFHLNVHETAS